jgi:hypothetical protein
MKRWATIPVLPLACVLAIAVATQARAIDMSVGAPSGEYSARAGEHPAVLVASHRHCSAAAILTCNKIHKRSERERCLGGMHNCRGVARG